VSGTGYHVVAGQGALWVSVTYRMVVAKVDPVTLLTMASVPMGGKPQGCLLTKARSG
jgi:hypothetical protein